MLIIYDYLCDIHKLNQRQSISQNSINIHYKFEYEELNMKCSKVKFTNLLFVGLFLLCVFL